MNLQAEFSGPCTWTASLWLRQAVIQSGAVIVGPVTSAKCAGRAGSAKSIASVSTMKTSLAMLAIAALFVVQGSATATTPDIQQRDELIADQENLLNAYRCMFKVDVSVVPGGCPTPDVVIPGPVPASPSQKDIDVRDGLIQDQEALLNVYRCRFGVDTEVVPGGCIDGAPAPDSGPAHTQVIGCSPTLPDNALVIVDSPSPGAVL